MVHSCWPRCCAAIMLLQHVLAFAPSSFLGVRSAAISRPSSAAAISRKQLTVTMGIPKLFRWLTDQYPAINQRINDGFNEVSSSTHIHCLLYIRS
jgi:hypothetical protein